VYRSVIECIVLLHPDTRRTEVAEVTRAREILEAERKEVVRALRANRAQTKRLDKRRVELFDKQHALDGEAADLLARGKDAGLSVTEMAEALEATRQWAHKQLRERRSRRISEALRGFLDERELDEAERAEVEKRRAARAEYEAGEAERKKAEGGDER
jgi:hypothetical protein